MLTRLKRLWERIGGRTVDADLPVDLDDDARRIVSACRPYTMTSVERLIAIVDAVRYLRKNDIPGAIVECGVWRGGSSMAAALTLISNRDTSRSLYLYDTFEGMSEPTTNDRDYAGQDAQSQLQTTAKGIGIWCTAAEADVRENMASTKYPSERMVFVRGRVEETVPGTAPQVIALLRLDTDWYESTRHELHHLFPRLSRGGICIIDDYGHWQGARKAVDEFLAEQPGYYLHRVDYTCRLIVKH